MYFSLSSIKLLNIVKHFTIFGFKNLFKFFKSVNYFIVFCNKIFDRFLNITLFYNVTHFLPSTEAEM
jgi:hypothetical protein